MSKIANTLPHTAIATWSGFVYQGRVALYHVLKLISDKPMSVLDKLSIQIDSLEDFAITELVAGELVPLTMHQVKAVGSSYYSTYKDDFVKLEKKVKATGKKPQGYFHLSTKNEKKSADIEVLHPGLKIYCYDADDFCSLKEIDDRIKQCLALVLKKLGKDEYNSETMQLLCDVLEMKITDTVIHIHSLNHQGISISKAAYEETIPLKEFVDIIGKDVADIVHDQRYFESKIRQDLNRYYHEFCLEQEEPLTDDVKAKLNDYLSYINTLNSDEFKLFLQSIRPHHHIDYSTIREYKDSSLVEEEVKDAFLVILMEIRTSSAEIGISWRCKDSKQYYPTCINASNSETSKKRVSRYILATAFSSAVDVPFNADYLVTRECVIDSIEHHANNITHISETEAEKKGHDKITRWRKLGLIDLENAKTKLND